MDEIKIVENLYEEVESKGLFVVIKNRFSSGVVMQLPFTEKACEKPIEELNLSVRSYNCLKRAGINTVEKVVETIQKDELLKIRNLGSGSRAEIRVVTCEFGYESLSARSRKEFIGSLYRLNKEIYKSN